MLFWLLDWARGGGCEEGGLEREQERREGGVEASLGLSGNLNGVETGLEATQQIHLNTLPEQSAIRSLE